MAQESADRAERNGKMMAREAAKRLAEHREKMEALERQNELVGMRPDDVSERYAIKPAVPDAAKTQPKSPSPHLSPNSQRVVMPRRAWLPSKGWKSDREGGEDGRKWAAAYKPRSTPDGVGTDSLPSRYPSRDLQIAKYDPEAAKAAMESSDPRDFERFIESIRTRSRVQDDGGSAAGRPPPRKGSVNNVYPYHDALEHGEAGTKALTSEGAGLFGGWFGGGGPAAGGAAPAPP